MRKTRLPVLVGVLACLAVFIFSWIGNSEDDLFTQAINARQRGDSDLAYQLFEQAAEQGIRPYDAYYEMGLILMEKEKWVQAFRISSKAVSAFQDYLMNHPQDDNAWFRLAYIYEVRSLAPTVNEWKQAIDALQMALTISPENSQYLLHLGYVYYKIRKSDEAEKILLGLVEKYPDYFDARYYLAMSYLENQEKEKAWQQFNFIVEHAPKGNNYLPWAEKELKKLGGGIQ